MRTKSDLSCPVPECSFTGSLSQVIHHITEQPDSDHTWKALGYEHSWEFRKEQENASNSCSEETTISETPAETSRVDGSNSVSLENVPGIGKTRAEALRENGYDRAADVADALITELSEIRTISKASARCIRTTAREETGSQDPFITSLSESLDVDRNRVYDAYAELSPTAITPEEAEETLERLFATDDDQSIVHLSELSLKHRHYLLQTGFETLEYVATASIEELTDVPYIGEGTAAEIRESARNSRDKRSTMDELESDSNSGDVQNTGRSDTSDQGHSRHERGGANQTNTGSADSSVTVNSPHLQGTNESYSSDELRRRAQELLTESIGPDAAFRPDQWDAIKRLVANKERVLLVQRTGWGKSTVYFIATKLLREQGHGPTLIISPLLALMHNQVQDASKQLDLEAWTINSNNTEEWTEAREAVIEGECDLLLISPERLANTEFQEKVLRAMQEEFGMLVVDEAHCISDWGHDFRPDYRRIKRILRELPEYIPVAATTATANDRVVDDVTDQVPELHPIRGDLVRESLRIQTIEMGSRARRLAWLAENIPAFSSAGIVYCLTTDEVETVTSWLQGHGVDVEGYHGGLEGDRRRELEDRLMNNEVDGLVATNALGMGFNKPDLGWVVHFQRPPNLIRYYQEIGRAGRGLDEAFAVLLSGAEDDQIAEFFIEQAFPDPTDFEAVLTTIEDSAEPLHKYQILKRVNVTWKAASQCLDILRVDNAIIRVDDGFKRTAADWSYDNQRIESVTQQRWEELERIKEFVQTDVCLTKFIDDELDGSLEKICGQCANCTSSFLPNAVQNEDLLGMAEGHYRADSWETVSPRYYIPEEDGRSKIEEDRKPEPGRALSVFGEPGYGELVSQQQANAETYSQELVSASVKHIETEWSPSPEPTWVTAIPTPDGAERVADLARRIASELDLEYIEAITRVRDLQPQHELANSYQKRWNVEGAFEVTDAVQSEPVLLVDETVGSRWTFTETSMVLRDAGCGPVYPFALAKRKR